MLLKKRSSAVCSKQGLMSDQISLLSPTSEFRNRSAVSSMIPSHGLDTDASVMSPTSILETKPLSAAGHHYFFSDIKSRAGSVNSSKTKLQHPWDVINSKKVGLGIVDALSNEKNDKKSSKAGSRMVLFGSQLKVQIPSTSQNSALSTGSVVSPHSLIEFGVKNKNSKLAMALLSPEVRSLATTAPTSEPSPPVLCLSPSEMELSEDYTRVVSHGPNPKTIHIFDTCTLKSCNNGLSPSRKEINFSMDESSSFPSADFLAFCQSCRKKLGQGNDIFMCSGEKAFCSHECRNRETFLDDEIETLAEHGPPAASPNH